MKQTLTIEQILVIDPAFAMKVAAAEKEADEEASIAESKILEADEVLREAASAAATLRSDASSMAKLAATKREVVRKFRKGSK